MKEKKHKPLFKLHNFGNIGHRIQRMKIYFNKMRFEQI